jgi:hypothetical protein
VPAPLWTYYIYSCPINWRCLMSLFVNLKIILNNLRSNPLQDVTNKKM